MLVLNPDVAYSGHDVCNGNHKLFGGHIWWGEAPVDTASMFSWRHAYQAIHQKREGEETEAARWQAKQISVDH